MKTVTIFGASDDLIEFRGDFEEEFGCYAPEEPRYLHFDDGTVLSIRWDDNSENHICWKIDVVKLAEGATLVRKPDPEDDSSGDTDNSQIVVLTGNFTTVPCLWEDPDGPSSYDVDRWIEGIDSDDKPKEFWRNVILNWES